MAIRANSGFEYESRSSDLPVGPRHEIQVHLQELALHEGRCFRERLLLHFHIENLVKKGLQTGLGLCLRHAGFEPPENLYPAKAAVLQAVECAARRQAVRHGDRNANLWRITGFHAVETRLAHADDRKGIAIDYDLLAHDVGVAAEAALPVSVAEDDQRMAALVQIVGTCEDPPDGRADAQHAKEVARYDLARDQSGAAFKRCAHFVVGGKTCR